MVRVFIAGGKVLNVDNEEDSTRLVAEGACELSFEEKKSIFGQWVEFVGPHNTKVDEDGQIIFIPLPEPTPAELAERARTERDRLMREAYDPAVMQLLRKRRVLSSASEDVAGIDAQLAEWDAYANALEVVPDQPGFPNSIEWPEAPSDSVVSGAEGGGVSCESESEPATSEV